MLGVLAISLVFVGVPALASADSLSWSAPIALDRAGGEQSLGAVSCSPPETQCTAFDMYNGGNEVTFDPTSGSVNAADVHSIDPGFIVDGARAHRRRSARRSTTVATR